MGNHFDGQDDVGFVATISLRFAAVVANSVIFPSRLMMQRSFGLHQLKLKQSKELAHGSFLSSILVVITKLAQKKLLFLNLL